MCVYVSLFVFINLFYLSSIVFAAQSERPSSLAFRLVHFGPDKHRQRKKVTGEYVSVNTSLSREVSDLICVSYASSRAVA